MCKKNWEVLKRCKARYENKLEYLYIAASQIDKKIKIGITVNIEKRLNQIKKEEYAALQGWQIVYYLKSNKANKLEDETLKNTKLYKCIGKYYKNGKLRDSREARSCNYKTIKSALEIAKEEVKKIYLDTVFIETWETPNAEQLFNFENLKNTAKR